MSIKFQCRLRLPYIIRLREAKDYEFEFEFTDFSLFKLTLLFNDSLNAAIFLENYEEKSCQFIQLEVITNEFDYQDYDVRYITIKRAGMLSRVEHAVKNVPEEVQTAIMKKISPRVNQIIKFIREKSTMFWLEDISINPTSNKLELFTTYYFYAPTAILDKNMNFSLTLTDNFMESRSNVDCSKVFDDFFDDFKIYKKSKYSISYQFLDRAKSSLHASRIYEAIIFAAIAEESFITKYINDHVQSNDPKIEKIYESKNTLMHKKYNLILKHLKGKSLEEINIDCWKHVTYIYKLRNNIMHTGEISSNNSLKLGFKELEISLNSIEKAFIEIERL